jgi:uncharacterized protein
MHLKFRQLPGTFSICRLPADAPIPECNATASFASITRTADELSIVCATGNAPHNAKCEAPWTCFKLEGPFPFAQTGVLASFIDPLATKGVPIFAISTFDTDYVLVKQEFAETALKTLQAAGHEFIS